MSKRAEQQEQALSLIKHYPHQTLRQLKWIMLGGMVDRHGDCVGDVTINISQFLAASALASRLTELVKSGKVNRTDEQTYVLDVPPPNSNCNK